MIILTSTKDYQELKETVKTAIDEYLGYAISTAPHYAKLASKQRSLGIDNLFEFPLRPAIPRGGIRSHEKLVRIGYNREWRLRTS